MIFKFLLSFRGRRPWIQLGEEYSLVYRYFHQSRRICVISFFLQLFIGFFHVVSLLYLIQCFAWYHLAEAVFRQQKPFMRNTFLQQRKIHMILMVISTLQLWMAMAHQSSKSMFLLIWILAWILLFTCVVHRWCLLLVVVLPSPYISVIVIKSIITLLNIYNIAFIPWNLASSLLFALGFVTIMVEWL